MAFLLEEHSRLDFWNGGDGMAVVMYGLEKVVALSNLLMYIVARGQRIDPQKVKNAPHIFRHT